ncbi:MAG TPA: hypothetical protein VM364_23185 [Vicinamibacterales bacterium]|nr:hypothetical protein [Vicinamibacterales bacterium]
MKVATVLRRLLPVLLVCGAAASAPLRATEALLVTASAADVTGSTADGVMNATFKISVTNGETSDMTAFFVVFDDDSSAAMPDVAGGETVTSESITKAIDVSGLLSQNSPIKVRLRFTFKGDRVEVPYDLPFPRR